MKRSAPPGLRSGGPPALLALFKPVMLVSDPSVPPVAPLSPGASKDSSHSIETMSRWLVGSSNKRTSGSVARACARATRFFWPPDRLLIRRLGSRPNRSMARSAVAWSRHPSEASSSVCSVCMRSSSASKSLASGSASASETSCHSRRAAAAAPNPETTASKTVCVGSSGGSWAT